MTIIVEDGTGKADAETYISVSDADTYHSERANSAWAALATSDKEAYLRRATEHMLGEYRLRWLGRRRLTTQALDWPRVGVVIEDFAGGQGVRPYGLFQVDHTIVPTEVKRACAELALRASNGTLTEDLTQAVKEETVGPITTKYDNNSSQQVRYQQVDNMLRVYLISGGNRSMVKLSRC